MQLLLKNRHLQVATKKYALSILTFYADVINHFRQEHLQNVIADENIRNSKRHRHTYTQLLVKTGSYIHRRLNYIEK